MNHEAVVNWQQFVEAVNVFQDDYGIVGHDGEPRVGFFDEPRPHMNYTVTGEGLGSESDFLTQLKSKPVVVFIECMDRRGASLAYQKVKAEHLPQGAQIFHFAAGGGVIQRDEIVKGGEAQQVGRGKAFSTIMRYIAQNAEVVKVVATDHDHRCGAEAFAADGRGWPERLDCVPGDQKEQEKMKALIIEYSEKLLPAVWNERGVVETALVVFSDNPETDAKVEFVPTK